MTSLSVLARRGQLQKHMADERRIVRAAPLKTVKRETRRVQLAIRGEVNRAIGERRKVGGAIRSKVYDNEEDGAAGIVYSRFGRGRGAGFVDYLTIFTKGATLRPNRSKYLVIPVKGISRRLKRKYRDLSQLGTDPKLALIPQRGGRRLLFVRRTRTRTTLLAILVRRVRVRKKLDLSRFATDADRRIAEALVETLDEDADAQP